MAQRVKFQSSAPYLAYINHDKRPPGLPAWPKDASGKLIIPPGEIFCRATDNIDGEEFPCQQASKFPKHNLKRHAKIHGDVAESRAGDLTHQDHMHTISHYGKCIVAIQTASEQGITDPNFLSAAIALRPKTGTPGLNEDEWKINPTPTASSSATPTSSRPKSARKEPAKKPISKITLIPSAKKRKAPTPPEGSDDDESEINPTPSKRQRGKGAQSNTPRRKSSRLQTIQDQSEIAQTPGQEPITFKEEAAPPAVSPALPATITPGSLEIPMTKAKKNNPSHIKLSGMKTMVFGRGQRQKCDSCATAKACPPQTRNDTCGVWAAFALHPMELPYLDPEDEEEVDEATARKKQLEEEADAELDQQSDVSEEE